MLVSLYSGDQEQIEKFQKRLVSCGRYMHYANTICDVQLYCCIRY